MVTIEVGILYNQIEKGNIMKNQKQTGVYMSCQASDNMLLLVHPKIKYVTFSARSFREAAPVLWNGIPPNIHDSNEMVSLFKIAEMWCSISCAYYLL